MNRKLAALGAACALACAGLPGDSLASIYGGLPLNPGTAGLSYDVNRPALPNVGANFGSTGNYANYVLIQTVPLPPIYTFRSEVFIQNNSASQIILVLDDGTASTGSQPVNATVIPLASGAGAGAPGAGYSSQSFKGRVQIYAPSATAQVAVTVE